MKPTTPAMCGSGNPEAGDYAGIVTAKSARRPNEELADEIMEALSAADLVIVPKAILAAILTHNFVDDCQECAVGKTKGVG